MTAKQIKWRENWNNAVSKQRRQLALKHPKKNICYRAVGMRADIVQIQTGEIVPVWQILSSR